MPITLWDWQPPPASMTTEEQMLAHAVDFPDLELFNPAEGSKRVPIPFLLEMERAIGRPITRGMPTGG